MKTRKKKILFIISGAVLIAALLFMIPASLNKVGREGVGQKQDSIDDNTLSENRVAESDDSLKTVIFCASDYQKEPQWDPPSSSLTAILDAATAGRNDENTVRAFIMCGDYTNDRKLYNHQLSPDESISEIKSIVRDRLPEVSEESQIFVQGNHDALTDSISDTGLHEFDDYLVYVLNTQNDNPWCQGSTRGALKKVKASSDALRKCLTDLAERGETRPVIIATHVPLHFSGRSSTRHSSGDNMYSSLIFDAVNEAGKDLDIIFLYGHNHSKGWDCYMGGSSVFKRAGDTILIPEMDENAVSTDRYTEETLNFTYMNAGYVGYFMNCGTAELDNGTWHDYDAADTALTGTVIEIYGDRMEISRYASDGLHHLGADGEADPYKGGIDSDLIDEKYYGTETDSPFTVMRKTAR